MARLQLLGMVEVVIYWQPFMMTTVDFTSCACAWGNTMLGRFTRRVLSINHEARDRATPGRGGPSGEGTASCPLLNEEPCALCIAHCCLHLLCPLSTLQRFNTVLDRVGAFHLQSTQFWLVSMSPSHKLTF